MRHVSPTGAGPVALSQAHQTPPTTSDEATRRWHGLAPHKQSVVDRLLEDQYMLCCYSELRADLYGLGYGTGMTTEASPSMIMTLPTRRSLDEARARAASLRRQMIASQEELDWRAKRKVSP